MARSCCGAAKPPGIDANRSLCGWRRATLGRVDVSLRRARSDERIWLFELHEAAMGAMVQALFGRWDRAEQWQRFNERTEDLVEIVELDGQAVGAIHLATDHDGALLIGLIEVLPEQQGRGIGTRAVGFICDRARREGRDVTLRVRRANRARHLYERLGFRIEGENETHFLMRKT